MLKVISEIEGIVSTYINSYKVYNIGKIRSQVLNFNNGDLIQKIKSNPDSNNIFEWFDKKIETCKTNR